MALPILTGVILAGGRATRMGNQDKGLIEVGGQALYLRVLNRLKPQVNHILINANRNQQQYQQSGYPVISDSIQGFVGPLAGMLTGLEQSKTEWVLFVPCDTPFLPLDLASRLWQQRQQKLAAYAADGERGHPTLCLLNTAIIEPLRDYLAAGDRKLMLFLDRLQATAVNFADRPQAFNNFNTPEDCLNWSQFSGAE